MTDAPDEALVERCKCGSSILIVEHQEADEWSVVCRSCSNEGPTKFTKRAAVTAWNRLAALPAAPADVVEAQARHISAFLWNEIGHKTRVIAVKFGMSGWHKLVKKALTAAPADIGEGRWKNLSECDTPEDIAQYWHLQAHTARATLAAKDAEIEALRERVKALEEGLTRCAKIVDRNLYHQHEKIEDVPRIARALLEAEPGK